MHRFQTEHLKLSICGAHVEQEESSAYATGYIFADWEQRLASRSLSLLRHKLLISAQRLMLPAVLY
jgi:hypothetical protein